MNHRWMLAYLRLYYLVPQIWIPHDTFKYHVNVTIILSTKKEEKEEKREKQIERRWWENYTYPHIAYLQ